MQIVKPNQLIVFDLLNVSSFILLVMISFMIAAIM